MTIRGLLWCTSSCLLYSACRHSMPCCSTVSLTKCHAFGRYQASSWRLGPAPQADFLQGIAIPGRLVAAQDQQTLMTVASSQPPTVLADVVMCNMANLPGLHLNNQTGNAALQAPVRGRGHAAMTAEEVQKRRAEREQTTLHTSNRERYSRWAPEHHHRTDTANFGHPCLHACQTARLQNTLRPLSTAGAGAGAGTGASWRGRPGVSSFSSARGLYPAILCVVWPAALIQACLHFWVAAHCFCRRVSASLPMR